MVPPPFFILLGTDTFFFLGCAVSVLLLPSHNYIYIYIPLSEGTGFEKKRD